MTNDLAYIRNQLLNGVCDKIIIDKLNSILQYVIKQNNIFTPVYRQVINNALQDIHDGEFESAGYQINLVHNMPFNTQDFKEWDEDHFYEFELPIYFENADDPNRIKQIIIALATLINAMTAKK